MKIHPRSLVVAGLLCAAAALHAQDKVIRIGVVAPVSGPASYFGVPTKQGIDLALEEVNKTGVNGYKLQVQLEDSACSPLQATVTVKKLLEQFKPHIVIGEECSDASLAIAPILEQAKVPLLNAGSTTLKLTDSGYKYVFRIFPNAEQQTERLGQIAATNLNAKTAVVLYENTNAGLDTANGFERKFTSLGGKVLAKIGFARDVNDFAAIATRVASLGDIDVIPMAAIPGQAVRLTQALAQAKVTKAGGGKSTLIGPIYLPWGFDQQAGPSAVGYVRGVQFDPMEKRKVVQDFVATFKAKYGAGETPTQIQAHAYDSIMVVAEVVRRGATTSEGVREQLMKLKDFEITTSAKVNFDAKGQNVDPSAIHFVETEKDLSWKSLPW